MDSSIETNLLRLYFLIPVVRHVLNKEKRKLITSLWKMLYHRKSVTFGNEVIFTLTSSVQEVHVILK